MPSAVEIWEDLKTSGDAGQPLYAAVMSIKILFNMVLAAAFHENPSRFFQSLSPEALNKLTKKLETYSRYHDRLGKQYDHARVHFYMAMAVSSVLKGERSPQRVVEWFSPNKRIAWASCEAVRKGEATDPCPFGSSLEICERCLSVRYCGRKHQLDDWKRHKRFCKAPSW